MISDPLFYAVAVPAVIMVGLGKGGFGGGFAMLAVPLIALVTSPQAAAGIMLPILLVMDAIAIASYRRHFDAASLWVLIPGGMLGTALGWVLASAVSDDGIRLMVGAVAVVFSIDFLLRRGRTDAWRPPAWLGTLLGTISGFTSFVAHAGGPPVQMYLLPQRLTKEAFAATNVLFFASINVAKIWPYADLGQLAPVNLAASAVLIPVALLATLAGVKVTRYVPIKPFYVVAYASVFLIGLKLVWDGLRGTGWL